MSIERILELIQDLEDMLDDSNWKSYYYDDTFTELRELLKETDK